MRISVSSWATNDDDVSAAWRRCFGYGGGAGDGDLSRAWSRHGAKSACKGAHQASAPSQGASHDRRTAFSSDRRAAAWANASADGQRSAGSDGGPVRPPPQSARDDWPEPVHRRGRAQQSLGSQLSNRRPRGQPVREHLVKHDANEKMSLADPERRPAAGRAHVGEGADWHPSGARAGPSRALRRSRAASPRPLTPA